jgi:hypothetical protein
MPLRVIKGCTLLGEKRTYGDELTDEEMSRIPPRSFDALISAHYIEVLGPGGLSQSIDFATSGGSGAETLARLQASVDRLTGIVEALLGTRLSDIDVARIREGKDILLEPGEPVKGLPVDSPAARNAKTDSLRASSKQRSATSKSRSRSRSKPKSKPKSKTGIASYKKGQSIAFRGEGDELLEGVVQSVSRTRGVLTVESSGDVWEVDLSSIV